MAHLRHGPNILHLPGMPMMAIGHQKKASAGDGADLLTDLISFWELEEASGSRVDAHASNDLTDNNTVTSTTGKVGTAGLFVAANAEYLSHASNSSLQTGDIDWTVCAWVKFNSINSASNALVVCKNDDDEEYNLQLRRVTGGTGKFQIQIVDEDDNDTASVDDSGDVPSTGVWYFLIGGFDSGNSQGFFRKDNGTLQTQAEGAKPPTTTTDQFAIGGIGAQSVDGVIDQVGFWKRVLTPAEHTWLYNSGNGRAYSELG